MIKLHELDCPYGAKDCPKVSELRRMLEQNHSELDEVKKSVIQLETTIKNVSKILGTLVSILIAILGVMQV